MKRNKGFTLVELLAVIVVLAIIISIASTNVFRTIRHAREQNAIEMQANLKEAALIYVKDKTYNKYLAKCDSTFSTDIENAIENNDTTVIASKINESNNCMIGITIKDVLDAHLFEDSKENCKETDIVVVYRYTDSNGNSEYRSFVDSKACLD